MWWCLPSFSSSEGCRAPSALKGWWNWNPRCQRQRAALNRWAALLLSVSLRGESMAQVQSCPLLQLFTADSKKSPRKVSKDGPHCSPDNAHWARTILLLNCVLCLAKKEFLVFEPRGHSYPNLTSTSLPSTRSLTGNLLCGPPLPKCPNSSIHASVCLREILFWAPEDQFFLFAVAGVWTGLELHVNF